MSATFAQAAASFFGLPEHANGGIEIDADGLLLTVRIPLSDEDIVGIAGRMKELIATAPPVTEQPAFLPIPSVQEVMRNPELYVLRPECDEVMERAAKLSSKVRETISAIALARGLRDADNREAT